MGVPYAIPWEQRMYVNIILQLEAFDIFKLSYTDRQTNTDRQTHIQTWTETQPSKILFLVETVRLKPMEKTIIVLCL
jgi:hypothetical protein